VNQLEFQEHWKQRRGQVRAHWDRLSAHDVDRVGGRYEQFSELLQEKYGLTPAQAGAEIAQWLQQPVADHQRSGVPGP
jgi:hypothetical protein